ncbi:HAUS augmin-like complex subunit 6 [Tiliqua scincoides]|uniref:HAUS augmin-like complex subunit 6 n=1 Tax=Tiliqua scincoides TaxID=71010 RepID=UPI003463793B
MSGQPPQQPRPAGQKEHLWLCLLALGFDAGASAAAGKVATHVRLGENMFDKPNKDAFHIVTCFLFSKLDQSRCNEAFRFCFPPTDKKEDAEFRKQCCEWLRRISDECGNNFPPVVASLFLSPGGPKFIHLMFHFARYVIINRIKAACSESGICYPEAVSLRSSDLHMAVAKYRMAQNRFLQSLQKEDILIQELQKKAHLFSKQIRDLRHENADLNKRLQKMKKTVNQSRGSPAERIEKVRCMWSMVMETLEFLQKEREVVESVVKGHVDQYVLDGTSVAVSVPRPLLEKVEKEMHKFHVGNVYEAGKLNILTVIQLLNKALELLMHERHIDNELPKLDLQYIEGKTKFLNETILGLKLLRQKLKCEDRVSNESIAEKQREWILKWENCLGQSPFNLIKDPNPVLDLLPAMSPLSFTPATEEAYKTSIFCQYPASIPDLSKKKVPTNEFERGDKASGGHGGSAMVTSERIAACSPHPASESEKRMQIPSEKGSDTPKRIEHSGSQILRYKGRNLKPVETWKKRQPSKSRIPSSVKRGEPRAKALDHLAEEVAGTVASGLPQNTVGKGEELEDLIGTLISDPFVTKKQLPRTPENLITEIRSTWKKATQAEDSSSIELHHTEAEENISQDAAPIFKNEKDSSKVFFMSPCLSDTVSPFLELQSPFNSQKAVASHNELLTQQAAIGPMHDKMYCKQGLMHTGPNKFETENPELVLKTVKSFRVQNHDLGESIATETLSPYLGQNSSLQTTLPWDASQMVSGINSDSHDVIQLGILQETFPDEGGSTSLDISSDLGAVEVTEDKSSRDDKALSDCVVGSERKLDFQSIRSRYEALKKAVIENKDSLSSKKEILKCRSEYSLSPVSLEPNDVLSPRGKPYALDVELVKTSLHTTVEREITLSPFLFSALQPREKPGTQD